MIHKIILLAQLNGVAEDLARGNKKSQRMARILEGSGDLLGRSEKRFGLFWNDSQKIYNSMSKIHNKMYQKLGGQLGTGEFFGCDIDLVETKTGIDLKKLLDGVDTEGYMKLQIGITQIRSMKEMLGDATPFSTPESEIISKVEHCYWLALMSVYEWTHQEAILKLINRYDTKMS